jgi:hypothetical protein
VTFIAASDRYLGKAAKDVCHAIKTSVSIEVVDTETLTQSQDTRGDTSGWRIQLWSWCPLRSGDSEVKLLRIDSQKQWEENGRRLLDGS